MQSVADMTRMIKQIVLNEVEDIHTMFIAKIVSVDNVKRIATVELLQKLIKTTRGTSIQTVSQPLEEVPVSPIFESQLFSIWAPYQVGDKVVIQISERPLNEALVSNEIAEQQQHGRMQIGYGIVMKPIPMDLQNGEQNNADSLYIEHKGTGNYFKFTSGGDIEISANVKISGDLEVSGTSTAEDHISDGISGKNHIHGGVQSGTGQTGVPQ